MVLCLTYAYVTKVLCSSVTMSSKPMSSVLHKSLTPSGGEAVYHESERTKLIH